MNPRGARVEISALTGPTLLTLQLAGRTGQAYYDAFRACVTAWENAPLIRKDEVAESYDAKLIEHLMPLFVLEVVTAAMNATRLSEDERKNS